MKRQYNNTTNNTTTSIVDKGLIISTVITGGVSVAVFQWCWPPGWYCLKWN